jgi:hypothetical protein
VKQKDRLDGQKALAHPWFKMQAKAAAGAEGGTTTGESKISDDVIQRLRSFKGVSTFKKAAMNLLVKTASEDEVQELRAQF